MITTRSVSSDSSPDLLRQQQLVDALLAQRYFSSTHKLHDKPKLVESHISFVLLCGNDAYKIKKALDLGFLDFSTLALRQFYCAEEVHLNRRFSSDLYLDVVPIGGSPEEPVLGAEPAIEYAVHMRRFSQSSLMDSMLARDRITHVHIDRLSEVVAHFHAGLLPADAHSSHYDTAGIQAAMLENFSSLQPLLGTLQDLAMLDEVYRSSVLEFSACEPYFRKRADTGCVRECHGDLHLGNIALLDDIPTPFDGIEFSSSLRWVDVISEISFPFMDLMQRGYTHFAWRLLNAYLEITGDYGGCRVLRFYAAYRAMVRAKTTAIRANQLSAAKARREIKLLRSYLDLACRFLKQGRPALIITHGLPGCGKSTFSQIALERFGAIRLRSDVERKRIFGLAAHADSRTQTDTDIYSEQATQLTYRRLHELARDLISAGFTVVVDAAFLRYTERKDFRALAAEMVVPFVIASLQTDGAVLSERLELRAKIARDASEADIAVYQQLQITYEPIRDDERDATVTFNNNGDLDALRTSVHEWNWRDADGT